MFERIEDEKAGKVCMNVLDFGEEGVSLCVKQLIISAWIQTEVIAPDCAPPPQVWVEF